MSKLDKKYRKEIEKYFKAPTPQNKNTFLNKISDSYEKSAKALLKEESICGKISLLYMLFIQFSYISKWLWVFSILVFLCTFIIRIYEQYTLLWSIFAVIPFIVTFSLSESMRSVMYGMCEFEMTSRFSFKSIIMARIVVLGTGNMALFLAISLFLGDSMWRNILYILVPYLSSATGGLVILRKFTSKEGVYMSFAFSIIISLLCMEGAKSFNWIYETRYTGAWIIVTAVLLVNVIYECYKTVDVIGNSI